MDTDSLALHSDFITLKNSSKILRKKNYIAVHTPQNPDFHWGNFLIFDHAPNDYDLLNWEKFFCFEFPECKDNHRAYTWTNGNEPLQITNDSYSTEQLACLSTTSVKFVPQINTDVIIRKIQYESEWTELENKQISRIDPEEINDSLIKCIQGRMRDYKSLVNSGYGEWFIADLDGEWVGDLGFFFCEEVGCFENVTTYPGYEGKGIAHALVYHSANLAFENFPINFLTIVTEEGSRADKIYRNLGFKFVDRRINLYRAP